MLFRSEGGRARVEGEEGPRVQAQKEGVAPEVPPGQGRLGKPLKAALLQGLEDLRLQGELPRRLSQGKPPTLPRLLSFSPSSHTRLF